MGSAKGGQNGELFQSHIRCFRVNRAHICLNPGRTVGILTLDTASQLTCLFIAHRNHKSTGKKWQDSVEFLRALGSQSGVSMWQHTLVG